MTPTADTDDARTKSPVLIIEPKPPIAHLLRMYLDRAGFDVAVADDLAAVCQRLATQSFDLVILGTGLLDADRRSALDCVRAHTSARVLMLSALGETAEPRVDDHLAGPFACSDLLIRVRRILAGTRCGAAPADPDAQTAIRFRGWVLDLSTRQLLSPAGAPVHVTEAEYRILVLMARNPGTALTRDQLADAAVGRAWTPFDRNVDVHISNLRRKLAGEQPGPSLIRTVRNAGYMFVPDQD